MTTTEVIITEPGIHDGMPEDVYHADPVPGGSLSSTGARKLLPPHCPARYAYELLNPPAPRPEFDFGKVAHQLVLGVGSDVTVIDAPDWRTKNARDQRDHAYANGQVPLLVSEYDKAAAMADAIANNKLAAGVLSAGKAEQSAFWTDPATGIWRRARFDWLRATEVVDLKTCASADPDHIQRAIHNYGYHQQAAWYLDAVRDLGHCDDPAFVFVFVEKAPPHLVHVVQLDADALAKGAELNRQAIGVYADCQRTGLWPGYADDITTLSLPPWATRNQEF